MNDDEWITPGLPRMHVFVSVFILFEWTFVICVAISYNENKFFDYICTIP